MPLYRWAGNEKEWTEFALRLRPDVVTYVEAALGFVKSESGCEMSIETERIRGESSKLLRFVRGSSGAVTNDCMDKALRVLSRLLESYLGDIAIAGAGGAAGAAAAGAGAADDEEIDSGGVDPDAGKPGRVQKTLEIPGSAVGLVYGKNGRKMQLIRKQSGAFVTLVQSKNMKGRGPAKLTISGSAASVEAVVKLVKQAITGSGVTL
jgi:hypothetical protein